MSSEASVKVGNAVLYARSDGAENLPALLLVHGLATNNAIWDKQVATLSQKYRIVRYDIRGHGKSSAPPAPYSMDDLAADLFGVLAHFKIVKAHIAGVSLGGLIVGTAAIKNPAALTSVSIIDSRVDLPPEFLAPMKDRIALVREKGVEPLVEPFITRWFIASTVRRAPESLEPVKAMIRATTVEGFVGCTQATMGANLWDRLPEIKIPALIMVGDQDPAVPIEAALAAHNKVQGSQYMEISAAGHLPNYERPELFNATLQRFLSSVPN